jgi:hypothetical protein
MLILQAKDEDAIYPINTEYELTTESSEKYFHEENID